MHVPFCASRCGYCDFNTYAPGEGASRDGYVDAVVAEIGLAGRVLGDNPPPQVETVFFGGGTPTLLPAGDLNRILDAIDTAWGLAAGAEVTTEANPESVDPAYLRRARGRRLHPDLARHAVGVAHAYSPCLIASTPRAVPRGRRPRRAKPGLSTSTWI